VSVRIPLLLLGVTALCVVGCSSGTTGAASPTKPLTSSGGSPSPTGTSTSGNAGAAQAPRVAHPLDASAMTAGPCSSLTAHDLAALHLVNPINKGESDSVGSQCTWSGNPGGGISIGWETADTHGLSNLYARRSTIAYWKPTTVAGYPAAYGDVLSDDRSQGDCVLNVGVSDTLYFDAEFNDPDNAGQTCALAEQAATDVIHNLGGA
jgi:hypothetical protein